jgi:hypothetical protein
VALASTFPVLDTAAATCLTRKMMLRQFEMLAVLPDLARAAFLHATTIAANVSGADPNFQILTTLTLWYAARSEELGESLRVARRADLKTSSMERVPM